MTTRFLKTATAFALVFIMIFSAFATSSCQIIPTDFTTTTDPDSVKKDPVVDPIDDNYRTFYQIFVGSFSDGNNDGIGDLQGIINRLDYLNDGDINSGDDLGVQGIWLSPIFSSPSYHKYDAKDYYKIDWRFGTEDTLKQLVELCHERNVKVILDLAINHTSNQHPWFIEFKEARMNGDVENKYYDFYEGATTADKKNGSTYQKIAGVDYWYECNFSGDMPELNYDNPDVREAMLDVARYYLELGVDGFRFDAVKYIYYGNTAKSTAFWDEYMAELRKDYPDIYVVGECWSGESEILKYYSSMNCFNFAMSSAEGQAANAAKGSTSVYSYANYIATFQDKVLAANPDGMVMNFLSNHDQDRIAGAFVTENYTKMVANLYLLAPGSPVIYYGEEIGIRGSRGDAMTDANRRLAMLWGDEDLIRDPVGSTYLEKNQIKTTVATQLEDESSMLSHYQKLIAIRHKHPEIARGDYTALGSSNKKFGGFLVEYKGESLLIFHNTSTSSVTYDLSTILGIEQYSFGELTDYIGAGSATLEGSVLTIDAQTSVIIK